MYLLTSHWLLLSVCKSDFSIPIEKLANGSVELLVRIFLLNDYPIASTVYIFLKRSKEIKLLLGVVTPLKSLLGDSNPILRS